MIKTLFYKDKNKEWFVVRSVTPPPCNSHTVHRKKKTNPLIYSPVHLF